MMQLGDLDWRQAPSSYPVLFVEAALDVACSALVIVDMQRYWTDLDGPMSRFLKQDCGEVFDYFQGMLAGTLIPNLARVLEKYRELGLPVIHVVSGMARPDGKDLIPHLQRRAVCIDPEAAEFGALRIGSRWHEETAALAARDGEVVLNKTSRSAFSSTGIDSTLRSLGVRHLVVGGIASDACVDLTARDATDHGYETFLLADGSGTFAEDTHQQALRGFQRLWGRVVTADEVLTIAQDGVFEGARR